MLPFSLFTTSGINRAGRFVSVLASVLAGPALAQEGGGVVTLGTASGAPDTTITVQFEFDNTENADALEARARIQGIDAFSQVDATRLCENATALIVSCTLNDTNRLVVSAANAAGTPIASFTGSVAFTIAPSTPGGTEVVLEWDAPADDDLLFTPSSAIDGLVSVVTEGPQVSIEPDALDFGEVEVGFGSSSRTTLVTNSGNADGLEIDAATTATENFTIVSDGCAQAVLAQGESCAVDVTFMPQTDGTLSDELSIPTSVGTASAQLTGTGTAGTFIFSDRFEP